MAKYIPKNFGGDLAPLNPEFEKIAQAIDKTLSRVGDTPNAVTATIDLNGQRLINLPAPIGANEPARLKDVQSVAQALPDQTGNNNKYLKTDGNVATWQDAVNSFKGRVGEVQPQTDDYTANQIASVNGYVQADLDSLGSRIESIETTYNNSQWDAAYRWGDHALAGYALQADLQVESNRLDALTVATVAEAKELQVPIGTKVVTSGYYEAGDEGGNDYIVVAGGTDTDDGGSFINMNSGLQLKGLFPWGVNVKQFGAKGDNSNDDTQPIQKTADYSLFFNFPEGDFVVTGAITIRGRNLNDLEYFDIKGAGELATRIRPSNNLTCFFIEKSELNNEPGKWMSGRLGDLSIIFVGASKSDTATAVSHTSCFNTVFENMNIEGATNFFKSFGNGQIQYKGIRFKNGQRPPLEGPDSIFLLTNNKDFYRSTGVYISDCEHFAAPIAENIFDLRAVDGLYVSNCHFNTAKYKVRIRMDNIEKRNVVKQVFFSNVYFDGNSDAQDTQLLDTVSIEASGAPNAVVDGIYFSNVFAREGRSFLAFNRNNTAGLAAVRNIKITGCHIRGYDNRWIYLVMGDSREATVVSNVKIDNNIFDDAPLAAPIDNLNCVVLEGIDISFTGNNIKGNWTDSSPATVLVGGSVNRAIVTSNILDTQKSGGAGNKDIVIAGGATNVIEDNNISAV